jgi:hypothetical protein
MLWAVCTTALLALAPAQAFPGDPLAEAKARRQVAIDRVDRIVLEAVQLAKRDPQAGGTALQNARREVEKELALPEERRQAHLRLIRAVEDRMLAAQPAPRPEGALGLPRSLPPLAQPMGPSRAIPPGSPADVAGGMIANNRGALVRQAEARAGAADNRQAELRRVEANASLPDRDMALPADWAEKSTRRSQEGRYTHPQKRIVAGLNKPLTANMDSVDLQGFFDWFEKQTEIDVQVDRLALETIGVGMQTEVPVKSRGLAARTVMRKVLSELGAAYIVTDDGLKVTSLEVAKNTMVTRVHYVGDLVYALNNYQFQPLPAQYDAAFRWYGWDGLALMQQQAWNAPLANQLQMNQNVQSLINMVKGTGDPESWEPVGPGRVTYDPITKSLIIKQTAEYHFRNGS